MSESSTQSGGIGILGLLQIIFIVMKLMNWGAVGSWSWWIVLIPTWIGMGIPLMFLAVAGVIVIIALIFGLIASILK